MNPLLNLGIAAAAIHLVIALGAVTLLWRLQLRTRNAGIIDAAWPLIIAAGAILYAATGTAGVLPRVVLAAICAAWALRLGVFLARRNHGPVEERRYAELRVRWGRHADRNMLAFFLFQALIAWILALSFLPAARAPDPSQAWLVLAAILGLIGIVGETIADAQLQRFKRDPANRGRVLSQGLWRYSRHPNYFFEIVHWLAYPCLAAGAADFWLGLIGPLLITILLLKVSGIPSVEDSAAASRRSGHQQYVRRTSALIPRRPRG